MRSGDEELGRLRRLSWHPPIAPAERLRLASEYAAAHELEADRYGGGSLLAAFEAEIARALGMEAALFLPTGGAAQLLATRIWTETRRNPTLALHPRSHIALREGDGFERVNRLRPVWIGEQTTPLRRADVEGCDAGCLLVELPLRSLGGSLPSWDDWQAIGRWAQRHDMPLHLDGARIWEASAAYARALSEVCAIANSVYVSFYKGLGSTSGAMLAGPRAFIASAREWQPRFGARVVELYPLAIPAKQSYDLRRSRFASYHARALRLAAALREIPELRLFPDPPHTNMFHVYFDRCETELAAARDQVARSRGIWLFDFFGPALDLGGDSGRARSYGEVVVGDALEALSDAEVADAMRELLLLAR